MSLTKGANAPLNELHLTFTLDTPEPVDLAALLVDSNAKARGDQDFLFAGASSSQGLSVTSGGGAQGWQIDVDLSEVRDEVEAVRLVATVANGASTFGQLGQARAFLNGPSGTPEVDFEIQGLGSETSLVVLELYRRQGMWKVRAVGQGYAGGLPALLADHGINAAKRPSTRDDQPVADVTAVAMTPQDEAAPVIPRPTTDALWKHIESPGRSKLPVRPVAWSTRSTRFTVCESVRNTVPESAALPSGTDKFMVTEEWAHALRAVRGGGFESTWRDDSDARLDPTWVTLRSARVDAATGRIVACGHLTHENWNLSPAYDLGAVTGSNGMSWPSQGHADGLFYPTEALYIGSTTTGTLVPVDTSSNLGAVDLDGATGTVGVLESLGTVGCLAVYDGEHGTKRRLALLDKVSGNERLHFSLDGRWLLVPRYDGSYLCDVDSGQLLRLPVTNCCWWPLADSTLLEIAHIDGRCVPRLFSLEVNDFVETFPDVVLDHQMFPDLPYIWSPAVSPDGSEVLVLTPTGVSAAHREEHAVGSHLARFTLVDGRGELVYPALLDAQYPWERDVSEARWTAPYPRRNVRLHPDLEKGLEATDLEHDHLSPGRYAPEAEQVLVKTLNLAIAHTQQGEDLAYLMPEIVASLVTLHEDPGLWAGQRGWLAGLVETTSQMISNRELVGRDAEAWGHFRSAMQAIDSGRGDATGSLDAMWTSETAVATGVGRAPTPSPAEPTAASAGSHPSATADQREMMDSIRTVVADKRGGGSFEPKQIAAISTLCERLVAENPDLTSFVDELRRMATDEAAMRPNDPAWRALVNYL